MTTTKQKVQRLAKQLGVRLDEMMWDLTAPKGYKFTATESHCIVFEPSSDLPEDIAEAWEWALADLKMGLVECPPDCRLPDGGVKV